MNKNWLFLLTVLLFGLPSQAQLSENFSDGDFITNPVWSGSNTLFTITAGELNSQSPTAANYYLSTPSTLAANAEFIFDVNLKFATSGSNYVDVYLLSDVDTLTNPQNGYFVRIGSVQDDIKLYKIVGGAETILIDGADLSVNSSTNNPFRIKVTRDAADLWTLMYDDGILGSFLNAGSVVDNTINSSSYFGVKIIQSSAASVINNHFFDNFSVGVIGADVTPPAIDSVVVVNSTDLKVYFNETVELTTSQTLTNYLADNGLGNPSSAIRDALDSSLVHLTFAVTFGNNVLNTLIVNSVEDLSGNAIINATETFMYIVIVVPNYKDVVINEIFADPTPQVGLPAVEFLELYNPSANAYNLSGWKFVNTTTIKTLSGFILAPNAYVILCNANDTALFSPYGSVIGISSFTTLTNGGDSLTLMDNNNNLLDIVAYDISWYQDAVKSDGGWTLELINPTNACGGALNWTSSISLDGGTPGTQNSIYGSNPDNTSPILAEAFALNDSTVQITFDENAFLGTVTLDNGMIIGSITPVNGKTYTLNLSNKLAFQTTYTVTVNGANDCIGNSGNTSFSFSLSEQGNAGDIVINEVLFNPFNGGSDFVEIYNNSTKYINLQNWYLANFDNDSISNQKLITNQPYMLLPGYFTVLTKDTANIKMEYINAKQDRMLQMTALPTYSNTDGNVYLINNLNQTIDNFAYNEKMHFVLLNDFKGVSLERIDYNRPSNDKTNWHSAAEAAGYATPGYENSQYQKAEINDEITISPETFSPDNDGIDDVVNISYQFAEAGYVANIVIYDAKGRLIKNLLLNELLGTKGTFSWDGINENNEKAAIGIYIIYFEAFKLNGDTKKFKKTCVLGGQL